MQTILMFGGNVSAPRGGAQDLMGVLPYLGEDVLLGAMLEHIKRNLDDKDGVYWIDVMVLREGTPRESRRWRVLRGELVCQGYKGAVARRSANAESVPAVLIRESEDWASV